MSTDAEFHDPWAPDNRNVSENGHVSLAVCSRRVKSGVSGREERGRTVGRGKEKKELEVDHCAEEKDKKGRKNQRELWRSGWRLTLCSLMLFGIEVSWK